MQCSHACYNEYSGCCFCGCVVYRQLVLSMCSQVDLTAMDIHLADHGCTSGQSWQYLQEAQAHRYQFHQYSLRLISHSEINWWSLLNDVAGWRGFNGTLVFLLKLNWASDKSLTYVCLETMFLDFGLVHSASILQYLEVLQQQFQRDVSVNLRRLLKLG
jgi:hypothetical protein